MKDLDILFLRLEAPLMSFGDVAVDERRGTREHPSRSMLTGLLANALGWTHGEAERLERLQERLRFATRRNKAGTLLEDYHTVDFGQDFMAQGWTTRGRPEGRRGASGTGTHIRLRHYLAGADYTVALTLDPPDEAPDLDTLESALWRPARPLFLGRKTCLPSRPLVDNDGSSRTHAPSLLAALAATVPESSPTPQTVWWSADDSTTGVDLGAEPHSFDLFEDRDWRNQIHTGRRRMMQGHLPCPGGTHDV